MAVQAAVATYLCGSDEKIRLIGGNPLNEQEQLLVQELARKRGISIPTALFY